MILLIRVDPDKKMDRWYAVAIQPTLLEGCAVVCLWGSRRSSYQRQRVIPTTSMQEARTLADMIVARKVCRGYQRLNEWCLRNYALPVKQAS